jgi:hypothetical protein
MSTLLDAINAGLGFTSNALSIQDSINRENANIRIQSAQLDFQTKTNDFLRSLEERSDYNNFEQDLDAFLNDYTATANKMAKSPYEAQAVNQMLQSSRVSLQDKIRDVTLQAQKNDTILTNQENELKRQQLKKDGIITSSQQMEQSQAETNQMFLSGVLDQETAMIKNKQIVASCFGDDVLTAGYDILDQGGNLEDALNAIDNMSTEEYKAYLTDANTGVNEDLFVDFDSLKANAKKELQGYWNTAIKSMQEKNVQHLSEIYSRLMMADPTEYNAILKQGQDTLMSMNGNKLSTTDREKYSRYFKEVENALSSSSGGSSGSIQQLTMKNVMDTNLDVVVTGVKNGDFSANDAMKVFEELMLDDFAKGNIKGYGATDRETAMSILSNNKEYYVFSNQVMDKIKNEIMADFPTVSKKITMLENQVAKGELSEEAFTYAMEGFSQYLFGSKDRPLEEVAKQLDKQLNAANLETITILNSKAIKDNEVAQFIETLNNTDEAYTKGGKTVFTDGLSEESLYQSGGGIDKMGSILAETLGVDKSKVHHSKTMKDDDVDYEAKFEVDGKQYEFRTTTEKTLFGESSSYEIVDENGNVVEGRSYAELRAEERERELQARQASTRAFGEAAALSYSQAQDKQLDRAINQVKSGNALQPEEADRVIEYVNKAQGSYTEILNKLGLSYSQWQQLSETEKRNKLIY